MNNSLFIIAAILIIVWAISFFGYHSSSLIHALLVLAILMLVLRISSIKEIVIRKKYKINPTKNA